MSKILFLHQQPLKADVLCESHLDIYQPNEKVTEYIEQYLEEYGE